MSFVIKHYKLPKYLMEDVNNYNGVSFTKDIDKALRFDTSDAAYEFVNATDYYDLCVTMELKVA